MKKILSSSYLLIAAALIITSAQMSSCSKDEEKNTTDTVYQCNTTVLGLWEGTFLTNQTAHAPGYVAFTLYSDSTISRRTKNPTSDIYSKGSWTFANNKVLFKDTTINFTSTVIQTGSFDYDAANKVLKNGVWQYSSNSAGTIISGTFSTMQKIK